MAKYIYKVHTGKSLVMTVTPSEGGVPVWKAVYPCYTESCDDGELMEEPTLVELGAMKDLSDISGLREYLQSLGIISSETELVKQ